GHDGDQHEQHAVGGPVPCPPVARVIPETPEDGQGGGKKKQPLGFGADEKPEDHGCGGKGLQVERRGAEHGDILRPDAGIDGEGKGGGEREGGCESGQDAKSALVDGLCQEDRPEDEKQVRLEGEEKQGGSGEEGTPAVEVEKQREAEQEKGGALSAADAGNEGREEERQGVVFRARIEQVD